MQIRILALAMGLSLMTTLSANAQAVRGVLTVTGSEMH